MIKCFYCNRPIMFVSRSGRRIPAESDRVRFVTNDPDGITQVHYQRGGSAVFHVSYVSTADGDACPECVGEGKKEAKIKKAIGKPNRLQDELLEIKKRRDDGEKEKEKDNAK